MSEAEEPPQKKQKIESLPNYEFNENQELSKLKLLSIGMDTMVVTENTHTLYTNSCMSCIALIIVARMNNGEIWHGMRHETDADNFFGICNGFDALMDEFKKKTGNGIRNANRYLVTIPELKDKRIQDVDELDFSVTVYSPDVDVEQIKSDADGNISEIDLKNIKTTVNVKLSKCLIEAQYGKP